MRRGNGDLDREFEVVVVFFDILDKARITEGLELVFTGRLVYASSVTILYSCTTSEAGDDSRSRKARSLGEGRAERHLNETQKRKE